MARFRATATISFELEAEHYKEALEEAASQLTNVTSELQISKKELKLEQLREKNCPLQLAEFDTSEILSYVSKKISKKRFKVGAKAYEIKINSPRYFVFRENTKCVVCGLEGKKFILEKNAIDKSPHFNLYAEEDGKLILMTKDHILPKSVGGDDRLSNFQTMCATCNNLKGSLNISLDGILKLRKTHDENKTLPRKKLKSALENVINELEKFTFQKIKKPGPDVIYINTDIGIWKMPDGLLMGQPIVEDFPENALQISCMSQYTEVVVVAFIAGQIVIKLSDSQEFYIHQKHVCFGKENPILKIE